jgi:hypothetical protein
MTIVMVIRDFTLLPIVTEIFALLGCYAVCSRLVVTDVTSCLTLRDGNIRLPLNIGT